MSKPQEVAAVMGRMTVGELAERLGVDVGELVLAVLQRRAPLEPASPRATDVSAARRRKSGSRRPPRRTDRARQGASKPKPRKAAASRPPTRAELQRAVDRWLLSELFEQEAGNISAIARRLGIERNQVRRVWRRVKNLRTDTMAKCFARLGGGTAPSKDELRAMGSLRAVRTAIDHWLIETALAQEDGNLSWAAARLGVCRNVARRLREELGRR